MAPKEVVLTANHQIDYLPELQNLTCNRFELIFAQNSSLGSAENTNFAVSQASGDIVKIMHQDDFFTNTNALENIIENIGESPWQASAFDHLSQDGKKIFNPKIPKIRHKIIKGVNSIGAPSVVAFQRKCFIPFDENMHYMFDCDWYLKMWHNWGKPKVLKRNSIRIRIHTGQATNWAKNLFDTEVKMTKANHQKKFISLKFFCSCQLR